MLFIFFIFSTIFTPIFSSFFMKDIPRIRSWDDAYSIGNIRRRFHAAHPMCQFDKKIGNAFQALLFCQSNSRQLKCQADNIILQKINEDEKLTLEEVNQICTTSAKEDQQNSEISCKSNVYITIALLICNLEKNEEIVEELAKYAIETEHFLPMKLERIKNDEEMSAESKKKIMATTLRYNPKYLWGAFIVREKNN